MFRPGAGMKHIVAANHLGVRISEKGKAKSHFSTVDAVYVDRIDTDRGEMDAARLKFGEATLKTPQLGVTEQSPMTAIKNQYRAIWRNEIGQRDSFSVLIRQAKRRCSFAGTRCLCGKRHLAEHVKNLVGKQRERTKCQSGEDRAEDFAPIQLRTSKRSHQASDEEDPAGSKE